MVEGIGTDPATILTVGRPGIGIAVHGAGNRAAEPALVFLHGLGSSHLAFRDVAGAQDFEGWRIVLLDLPGHGRSDRPMEYSYSIEAQAALVAELIRVHLTPPVTLVGHSLGGSVAIALATSTAGHHPPLLDRLIVAEPHLDPGGGTLSQHIARQSEHSFVARGYQALVRATQRQAERGDRPAAAFLESLQLASPIALHRSAVSLLADRPRSFRDQLLELTIPRITISGSATAPIQAAHTVTGLKGYVVPDSGHTMMIDNPAGFGHALGCALADDHRG